VVAAVAGYRGARWRVAAVVVAVAAAAIANDAKRF
jgi:hypothetical protein